MNKTSLKLFAIEARNELMEKMRTRLDILGITKNGIEKAKVVGREVEINGSLYPRESYNSLVRKYKQIGYEELVEESAYTWFNRLTALAFMEANEYIEEKMIFNNGLKNEPGIIDNYYDFEFFKNLDSELQKELHDLRDENTANSIEKLYSILVEEKCEELSAIMPFMFKKKGTYSDILFPTGLLLENSLLVRIREEIGKEAPIELIGWLYQFYNSEKKDQVFEALKKNTKITKENVPAATQLFTPDWIVKYMVENSLGKLALESTGINENLKDNWKYYIESELDKNSEKIKIEDVKILDPAMGSGHILVYAFDLLFEMYENLGWSTKESVLSILKNNLYGLEIDERAGQLASFALMMKAREKFSRLFSVLKREETFKLNTLIIEESNNLSEKIRNKVKDNNLNSLSKIIEDFKDAKEYGSILKLETIDRETLEKEFNLLKESLNNEQGTLIFNEDELNISIEEDLELIENLIAQHIVLTNKYEAVVTNPPYMGNSRMNTVLKKYIETNYSDVKNDLFAVFFMKCGEITKKKGYLGFMSPFVWMFIKSYEELRKIFIEQKTISSLVQLEYSGFEDATVPICTFVLQNSYTDKKGEYIRLSDFKGAKNQPIKTLEAIQNPNCGWRFQAKQKDFEKIPGSPIAYWVSDKFRGIFKNKFLYEYATPRAGMITGNNDIFLRLWNEVSFNKIGINCKSIEESISSKRKWFPYQKGGSFRKWYGNIEYTVNYENNGWLLKNTVDSKGKVPAHAFNEDYIFKSNVNWSALTSGTFGTRITDYGFLFDAAGSAAFPEKKEDVYILSAFLNSKISNTCLLVMNPTLNFQAWQIGNLPISNLIFEDKVYKLAKICKSISKEEWDSRETSWDFERLSLVDGKDLRTAFENYCSHWRDNFVQLHKNEEELNRLFIEIYELQDEMDEKVSFDDITILKKEAKIVEIDNSKAKEFSSESERYLYDRGVSLEFNKDELVKQFLSYAIGCIMGRYSTNKPGLIMANSDDVLELSSNKFLVKDANGDIRQEVETKFLSDEFGILPITAEKDFSNDIVERVKEFVKFVYGEESLKDNLNFIAEALGNKDNRNPEEILRTYFITAFYKDHLQRYQNRPIYWLMNSGKKNAFSCLFYMHRYEPLTVARVRADYLIHYQEMLENKRKFIERQLYAEDITAKEKKNVEKELKDLDILLKELREYANEVKHIAEQKIPLDLDDGVNVNYEKLEAILKKR